MKHESRARIIKRVRIRISDVPECLGRFALMVGEYGGRFGQISTVHIGKDVKIRDVDVHVPDEITFDRLCDAIRKMAGVDLIRVTDVVQEVHRGGKIQVVPRVPIESMDDLSLVYTPGVAAICNKIHANPELAYAYTTIQNNVAIVTNGTAILGLGDIGPVAGMPVMEGKAMLFRILADINGYPILIDSKDPEVVVQAVKAIAPTFGAIKLEDIRAPECFEIEQRLDAELDIPVLHDDQHGTAVVVLAALMNIAKATYLNLRRSSVGIVGLGAAGSGIARLLRAYGIQENYGADINDEMARRFEQQGGIATDLAGVMEKSKIVIATTGVPGLIKPETVRSGQVILALSNPHPEIEPDDAVEAGALFAMDGKSVNNAMAFPGLFRGALSARARTFNDAMKIAAAKKIAEFALEGDLVPNILDKSVHAAVADAVERAALKTGVVRFVENPEL
ncbi:MAG: NAD-dependent malic enzyme [Polyangiaceae bacterium]|jgi:malate dehydrogenase (oxaloacetate-decarboxylating)|nr:NAD-dependent malic enzyme [Polyangiaceae bacterium]